MTNVESIRKLYEDFGTGHVDEAAHAVTTDFIMHVPGIGPNAGEHWGRDGFRTFMRNILDYNGGTFSLDLRTVADRGDTVFTREVVTMNRGQDPQRQWELPFVMHYQMRDGLVAEAWTMPEDLYLYDEYWGVPDAHATIKKAQAPSVKPPRHQSASGENLKLLQRLYGYFWNGEYDRIQPLYASDFVFFAPGRGYLSGTYNGWDGYLEFRRKLMAIFGGKYRLDVDAIAASGTDVFAREFIRMNTTKHPDVRAEYVVMHFEIEGGKIRRANDFPVDLYEWERFFTN